MVAVEVQSVSKRFRRQTIVPHTTLKTTVLEWVRGRRMRTEEGKFTVLRDISFTLRQGQALGVAGRNGSGKSTLLKLLAGIYRPDAGVIRCRGRIGAILELGAGFHPEFSGRENVLINGIVLGLSKREIRTRLDEIVRFAELEDVIDDPVKTYSSGMFVRLGFAVAVHADPDILLLDEVLAVGDESFKQKCFDKMAEFRRRNKTVILVSHNLEAIEEWSDEAIWLDDGAIRERGAPRHVIARYRQAMHEHDTGALTERWGTGEVDIVSLRMLDGEGQRRDVFWSGQLVRIALDYRVHVPVSDPVFGITLMRPDGVVCYVTTTEGDGITVPRLHGTGTVQLTLETMDLAAGTYHAEAVIQARDGYRRDCGRRRCAFSVKSDTADEGIVRIPHRWDVRTAPGQPAVDAAVRSHEDSP
jgi:lipopolysaccharide transport system ATP-binding protein